MEVQEFWTWWQIVHYEVHESDSLFSKIHLKNQQQYLIMGNKQSNENLQQLETIESDTNEEQSRKRSSIPFQQNQIYNQESEGQILSHQTFGVENPDLQDQPSYYIPSNDEFLNQTYDDYESEYQCTCLGQQCECCNQYDYEESQSTIQQCMPSVQNNIVPCNDQENLVGEYNGIRRKMPLSKVNFLVQNKQDSSMITIQEMDEEEVDNLVKPQQFSNKVNNRYKNSIILSDVESGQNNNYQKFTFNVNHNLRHDSRSQSQRSQHCYQCLKSNIARSFKKQQSESVIEYEISNQQTDHSQVQKDIHNSTKIQAYHQQHQSPQKIVQNTDLYSRDSNLQMSKNKEDLGINSLNQQKLLNPYQTQFIPKKKNQEYFDQVMVEDENDDNGESPTLFDYRFMFCKLKKDYESRQINKKPSSLDADDDMPEPEDLDQFIKESIVQMIQDQNNQQYGEPQIEEVKTPEKDQQLGSKGNTIFETPSSTQDEVQKNNKDNVMKFTKWKDIRDSKQQGSVFYDSHQIKKDLKASNPYGLENMPKKVEIQNDNPLLSDFDSENDAYKSYGFGSSKVDVSSSSHVSTQKNNNIQIPNKHFFFSPSLKLREKDNQEAKHKRVSNLRNEFLVLDHYDEPVIINGKERHIVMQSNNQMIIYSQDPFLTPSQNNPKDKEYFKLLMKFTHIEQVNPSSEILHILDFNYIGTMVQKEIIGDDSMKLRVLSNQDPQVEVLAIKFQFYSKDVCQEWDSFISSILDMMKQNQSMTYLMLGNLLLSQVQFWLYPSMHEQEFLRTVDTGDILLFRSKNAIGNWVQRKITGSHFDHVCMILRYGEGIHDIYVFEAVGREGVRILKWEAVSFCIGQAIDKICFRKLHMLNQKEINAKQLRDLNLFRKITHGSQYGLSTTKLMTRQSVINSNIHSQNCQILNEQTDNKQLIDLDKQRKYFCSELVAKAHKILGIFKDETVSCTQYYPGCYDKNQQIDKNLKDDIMLGPVINVLVDNSLDESDKSDYLSEHEATQVQEFDPYKQLNDQME